MERQERAVVFIRKHIDYMKASSNHHILWGEKCYINGLIAAFYIDGVLSIECEESLKREVQNIYTECLDSLRNCK